MNTCYIHPSGAILLDVSNGQFLDNLGELIVPIALPGTPPRRATGQPHNLSSPDAGDIPDDNGEYPAPETSQVEFHHGEEAVETVVPMEVDPQPAVEAAEEFAEPFRRVDRLTKVPTIASVTVSNASRPVSVTVNPYRQLDPHEATPNLEKPMKKGRPFRIPDELKVSVKLVIFLSLENFGFWF